MQPVSETNFSRKPFGPASDFTRIFPEEINVKILSYLDETALTKCFRVNKQWKILASNEQLWQALPSAMYIDNNNKDFILEDDKIDLRVFLCFIMNQPFVEMNYCPGSEILSEAGVYLSTASSSSKLWYSQDLENNIKYQSDRIENCFLALQECIPNFPKNSTDQNIIISRNFIKHHLSPLIPTDCIVKNCVASKNWTVVSLIRFILLYPVILLRMAAIFFTSITLFTLNKCYLLSNHKYEYYHLRLFMNHISMQI